KCKMVGRLCAGRMKAHRRLREPGRRRDGPACRDPRAALCSSRMSRVGERIRSPAPKSLRSTRHRIWREPDVLHIADLWRDHAIRSFAGEDADVPPLDFATAAAQFPIRRERAYLNNASIGPMSEPVLAAINAFLHDVRDNGRNNYPTWCRYAEQQIKAR